MFTIKDILRIEVAPALGCTEPTAVALCTAVAGSLLSSKKIESIELWLDPNIYKNAMAVAIPGTDGATGIDLAAALGYVCGDPESRLQVLEPVTAACLKQAEQIVRHGKVNVNLLVDKTSIYIKSRIKTGAEVAEAITEELHDNITSMVLDGKELLANPIKSGLDRDHRNVQAVEEFLKDRTLDELIQLAESLDDEDCGFILEGVEYNEELARHGLASGSGLGIGKTLDRLAREGLLKKDMVLWAKIKTSAACDARMSGVKKPAMSSAGSGNHGLTAILPIWALKDYILDVEDKDFLKAIALSHVVTAYIKAHTGRLSAVCGCSIAAGAGAAAGVAYLLGGTSSQIAGAIKNLIEDLAGVICDGAKTGCALKLATAAGTAVQSALLALHGIQVSASDGIVASSPEQTMKNVGQLSTEGMIETDRTILKILIDKNLQSKND